MMSLLLGHYSLDLSFSSPAHTKNASSKICHYAIISFCTCAQYDPALFGAGPGDNTRACAALQGIGMACTAGLFGMLWFCLQSGVFIVLNVIMA